VQTKFLYFDLGKVLINFSIDRMLLQIGAVAGITTEAARKALFGSEMTHRYETGQISSHEFYEAFCAATDSHPNRETFTAAACEIFDLNLPVLPLVTQLRQAGYPMGILSNTCEAHWEYCRRHYRIVDEGFNIHALSYCIGALKPDAAIFHTAAKLAGHEPGEIFFVDDITGHVAGAQAAGFDAVQFTTAAALANELRRRGIRFNY